MKAYFSDKVTSDLTNELRVIANPNIGENPSTIDTSMFRVVSKMVERPSYLEAVQTLIPYGLQHGDNILTSLYMAPQDRILYGVTEEGQYISIMSDEEIVVEFGLLKKLPDAFPFSNLVKDGRVSLRDVNKYYNYRLDAETSKELEEAEYSYSYRQYLNDWANQRPKSDDRDLGLTVLQLLEPLEGVVDVVKLFGALYYNVEGYSSVLEIPLMMTKVLPAVPDGSKQAIVLLFNLILQRKDEHAIDEELLQIRYTLGNREVV